MCNRHRQIHQLSGKQAKCTNVFCFILTISHALHLVYSLAFQQLQGSTGSASHPTGTKDAVYTARVLTLSPLPGEIHVCPPLPKYWRWCGECEAGREIFVFTYNSFLFPDVSH